jgi:hemerythrin-like domain-containing protein
LLKHDHQSLERLFKRFEQAGDRAFATKRQIADRVVEELSRHAAIEEQLFYPVARSTVPGTEDVVLESLEEHHVAKWLLSELDGMDPAEERFDAKMTVLIETVRHHVSEEEQEFFPKVRDELGRNALAELGEAMEAARRTAPTHPHPRSPDTPTASAIGAAAVVDRIGDTVSGVAQGSVTAVQDLIARILGRPRRAPAPTGSTVSRDTARKVRGDAAVLTDEAVDGAKKAKRAAGSKADREIQRAKRTTTATKTAAARTGKVAKEGATTTVRTARAGAKTTAKAARTPSRNRPPKGRTTQKRASATD